MSVEGCLFYCLHSSLPSHYNMDFNPSIPLKQYVLYKLDLTRSFCSPRNNCPLLPYMKNTLSLVSLILYPLCFPSAFLDFISQPPLQIHLIILLLKFLFFHRSPSGSPLFTYIHSLQVISSISLVIIASSKFMIRK